MGGGEIRLVVLADAAALAQHVAGWMAHRMVGRAHVSLALAGGRTPQLLYETLADAPFRSAIDWARIDWFWGDERFVPADDAANNARMAQAALLSRVPVPVGQVHAVPTGLADAGAAALAYEQTLRNFAGRRGIDAEYLFDITLLGLGEDGHTASLFPADAALEEQVRWVSAARAPGGDARVTLTRPALERSRDVAFLVSGAGKRAILRRFLQGDASLPATRLNPRGRVTLFCDVAARGGG